MISIKRVVSVVAVGAIVAFGAVKAEAQQRRQVMLDKVVAVVGGSSILHSEVAEYAEMLVAEQRQMGYTSEREPMVEALENLLEQKLLFNQAQLDSIHISSCEIVSRI